MESLLEDVSKKEQLDTNSAPDEPKNKDTKDSEQNADNPTTKDDSIEDDKPTKPDTAEIIILNKITAKSQREILNVGEVRFFGNMSIEAHKCVKNTDPFNSNNFILLTVSENKIEEDNLVIYHGWLASSNLSIATIEHPVYEVIAMDCSINNKNQ